MKRTILIFTFFITLVTYSQKAECIIYFKDGTKKVGYVKYGPNPFASNITAYDKVKFRESKKSKKITKYKYSEISKIDLIKDGDILRTSYFKVPKKNLNIILDVNLVHKGNVSLYSHIINFGNGGSMNEYYVQRGEENIVRIFPGKVMGISSEKLMKRFFFDCPKLIELIDHEAFKKFVTNSFTKNRKTHRLIEIVKYYNAKCIKEN